MENIFVLDIGTRTVMALLATMVDGKLSVNHLLYKEHKTRAMLDGQIHDVEQVAVVIEELVKELEEKSGIKLKQVAVAAAGRSLKTAKGYAKLKYPISTVVSKEDHLSLELQAVQDAQMALPKQQNQTPLSQQYYCVGYSVVEERLDQIRLGTIIEQKGQEAEIEVVATFLPRIVIDSLQYAVEKIGLELLSITLEPIAVSNLVLNQTMRRLNLVLVDIGAGTSDIAVCGGNTISAFGMVPMAGDEITEALSDYYLLDFIKAEEVKKQLHSRDEIHIVDVLGMSQSLSNTDIKKVIEPAVNNLATAIAEEIFLLNGKAPQAVLLVGGGSMTPELPKNLAQKLSIPENRIAVQQAGQLENILNLPDEYTGPNFITVLGIAYTALMCPTMGFISVNINDQPVSMLNLGQNNIAEALLAGGYNIKDYYGRPGLALTCEINGQLYSIPGKMGKMGTLMLNDQPVQMRDKVKQGDKITFLPGEDGENAQGSFKDLLQDLIGQCTVNGIAVELNPMIKVNERVLSLDEPIQDGCKAELITNQNVEDVLAQVGLIDSTKLIYLNKKAIPLIDLALIKRNGKKVGRKEKVYPGDLLIVELTQNLSVGDFVPKEVVAPIKVNLNGSELTLNKSQLWVNHKPAERNTPVKEGDSIEYKLGNPNYSPILVDVFKEIKLSTQPPPGCSKLDIKVNNQPKEYTYELKNGDKIEINWI